MKHAYLIVAHGQWEQLKKLISSLDYEKNDIYIHIDKKAKNVPVKEIKEAAKVSNVSIFQKYKVYWGSFELTLTELFLFKKAHEIGYDYYHLLSGADFPIKSNDYIYNFFEINNGKEFVHFDTDERLRNDREICRRTKLYHFLQNYRRRFQTQFFNSFFTFLERILLVIQMVLKVDRLKKFPDLQIKYGSQWVSITDGLVEYILDHESLVHSLFQYTNCSDELFIQTLVYNSKFKERLFDTLFDDSNLANMRLIDMKARGKNGSPYTWRYNDLEEIKSSQCLWARKFNMSIDLEVLDAIEKYL